MRWGQMSGTVYRRGILIGICHLGPTRVTAVKIDGTLFFFNLFIYLFLAALGLRCSVCAFSSCSERRLLFIAVRGLLIAVASLVVEHRL